MNNTNNTKSNQSPQAPSLTGANDSEEQSSPALEVSPSTAAKNNNSEKPEIPSTGEEDVVMAEKEAASASADGPIEENSMNPATVFSIRLKQPKSNLLHKMSVPELCRTFR